MIPINCPSCGSYGEIPLDRLNSRLTCKKCKAVFHMDQTGNIVLGDPAEADKGKKKKKPKRAAQSGASIDLNLAQTFQSIPKPVIYALVVVVAVAAVGYGAVRVIGSMGLPSDLEGRAKVAGQWFAENELDNLKEELTVEGTAGDLETWFNQVRPQFAYDPSASGGDQFSVSVVVSGGSGKHQRTLISMVLIGGSSSSTSESADSDEEGPSNRMDLQVFWTDQSGEPLIDGTKTLEEAESR